MDSARCLSRGCSLPVPVFLYGFGRTLSVETERVGVLSAFMTCRRGVDGDDTAISALFGSAGSGFSLRPDEERDVELLDEVRLYKSR